MKLETEELSQFANSKYSRSIASTKARRGEGPLPDLVEELKALGAFSFAVEKGSSSLIAHPKTGVTVLQPSKNQRISLI